MSCVGLCINIMALKRINKVSWTQFICISDLRFTVIITYDCLFVVSETDCILNCISSYLWVCLDTLHCVRIITNHVLFLSAVLSFYSLAASLCMLMTGWAINELCLCIIIIMFSVVYNIIYITSKTTAFGRHFTRCWCVIIIK